MGYKEVFESFCKSCPRYRTCNPKCSIKLTENDKKEYEECAEINYGVVESFICSLVRSGCLTDNEKIPIYNLVFKRIIPTSYSTIEAIRYKKVAINCLLETKIPSISNEALDNWLNTSNTQQDIVHFCLNRAPMDKESLKILISHSYIDEDDNNNKNTKYQLIINKVTQTILANWNMVDSSLVNYICCKLDAYWDLLNTILSKGFTLTEQQIILIMIFCEVETIEKIIQKIRPVLVNDYFKAIICPSKFKSVLDLVSNRFNSDSYSYGNDTENKIKLIQKYGYVVTREDWILAIENEIIIDGVNFVADEDVFKICLEKAFFPELEWKSEELKKKCEFRELLRKTNKVGQIREWIKKNNHVPDENAMVYVCKVKPNCNILDLLVKSGGKVTPRVLHQTALGNGTRIFVTNVAKYYKEE